MCSCSVSSLSLLLSSLFLYRSHRERYENTNFDRSGPRYQSTRQPLEKYHFGRVATYTYRAGGSGEGFYCPTRWGGKRVRHGKPYLLKDGQPMNADEARFVEQKASTGVAVQQPVFSSLKTLPPAGSDDFTIYDRLSENSTTSRLLCNIYFAEERAAVEKARKRRPQSSRTRFVPL